MYHQYLIYTSKIPPPQKKAVLPNDLQKPTCYTKVPKLAPLVDVQRIPKFGYLSQTTGCDTWHIQEKPFVKQRGEPPRTQKTGGP